MAKHANSRHAAAARSIQQALALHQQGRLEEANQIYNSILARDPRDFDACI